ncbi:hypothetical protein DFQ14_107217 [Halopolyspora algeriensis]|uniref:Small secreted domain DUF320 n=2 Tax=Halopolyspora algeriensis TaxID=1500506 RepID=A0A368VS83_9ACTN|nr:hypothetical protein DFQ14_107217 [Halopolyspora algeriensis]TQM56384.1 hypothetical protein FHU43_1180 [Halopolyspora algeriensis]
MGAPAYAGGGNDGINILNDNNASVAPIQACGNNVAVVGIVAPIHSPQYNKCVNAPIVEGGDKGHHGHKDRHGHKDHKGGHGHY